MMRWMRKMLKSEAGFTLVELLIVLMVLGILATIAIPRFADMKGKANLVKAKTELKQVQTALELYYAENSAYPADDAAFKAALDDYVLNDDLTDYAFTYTITDGAYKVEVFEPGTGGKKIVDITRNDIK